MNLISIRFYQVIPMGPQIDFRITDDLLFQGHCLTDKRSESVTAKGSNCVSEKIYYDSAAGN